MTEPHLRRKARSHRWIALSVCLLPALWIFGRAICTGESFAFRDAGHYYYPLFDWIRRQWAGGTIPLWNPHESLGVPVAAEATSSVFYPGKLVFAMPLPYVACYKLYVLGHLLMAAATAYALARTWRRSVWASAFAAVAYAYGGGVVFQYCNVVFLVGAAWLPLSLWATDRMLCRRSYRWGMILAMTLAMMVLGGDPQSAYHAGLLAAMYAFILRGFRSARSEPGASARRRPRSLRLLMICAATAVLLAAVQVFPSIEWSRHSRRASHDRPRNVYEAARLFVSGHSEHPWRDTVQGIFGKPTRGTHHEHIYHFSVGPWHLAELIWPNFSGRLFPENHRWTNAIPAEGRSWTPTLYMGLLPVVFALLGLRLRGGAARDRWLSWTAVLGLLAAMGWHAVGWLVHEVACGGFGVDPDWIPIGHAVGGVYWLLVTLLPGYVYFRYPAKLLVLFMLAGSLLAARQFDRQTIRPAKSVRWGLFAVFTLSVVGLALSFSLWTPWVRWLDQAPIDAFFGPLDAAGAMSDLRSSLVHGALVSLQALAVLFACRRHPAAAHRYGRPTMLILTAVELAIAQGWLSPTAPVDDYQRQAAFASRIRETGGGFRVFRGSQNDWLPDDWSEQRSPQRLQQGMKWEVDTLYPKYPLEHAISSVEVYSTFTPLDYDLVLRAARRHGVRRADRVAEPSPELLRALSVRYLVLPDDLVWPRGQRVATAAVSNLPPAAALWEDGDWLPRVQLVRQVEVVPPLASDGVREMTARTEAVFFPDGQLRDFCRSAVVEGSPDKRWLSRLETASDGVQGDAVKDDKCRIIVDLPNRVEIAVRASQDCLLVLNDYYFPGWKAQVQTAGRAKPWNAPILRTNRVMRGVALPAGEHRVTFVYQPPKFYTGLGISLLAWCGVLAIMFRAKR